MFVDGNHEYTCALSDISSASRVVKHGGVVLCRDFACHELAVRNGQEVKAAVDDHLKADASSELYSLVLSVYPSAILLKNADRYVMSRMDRILAPWTVGHAPQTGEFSKSRFKQTLIEEDSIYKVRHVIEDVRFKIEVTTCSRRIFSGYYEDFECKVERFEC